MVYYVRFVKNLLMMKRSKRQAFILSVKIKFQVMQKKMKNNTLKSTFSHKLLAISDAKIIIKQYLF